MDINNDKINHIKKLLTSNYCECDILKLIKCTNCKSIICDNCNNKKCDSCKLHGCNNCINYKTYITNYNYYICNTCINNENPHKNLI